MNFRALDANLSVDGDVCFVDEEVFLAFLCVGCVVVFLAVLVLVADGRVLIGIMESPRMALHRISKFAKCFPGNSASFVWEFCYEARLIRLLVNSYTKEDTEI